MTYQEIISLGLQKGISEIEVYAKTSTDKTLKVFGGNLESYNGKEIFSVSIRGLVNGKMGYASCESLDENIINETLDKLITAANLLTSTEVEEIYGEKVDYEKVTNLESDAANYSLAEKTEFLKSLEQKAFAADERIKQVGYCQYVETEGEISIINSKGINLSRKYSYQVVVLGVVALENGKTNVGFTHKIESNFNAFDADKIVKESVEKAVSGLNADSVKSGSYPVILDQEVASDLFTAFAVVFSGYAAMKNMTMLIGKKGEKVFGDNVTLTDDFSLDICEIYLDDVLIGSLLCTMYENRRHVSTSIQLGLPYMSSGEHKISCKINNM